MDCRYCALQVYFNNPVMEVYVNLDEMLEQLNDFLGSDPHGSFCSILHRGVYRFSGPGTTYGLCATIGEDFFVSK